MNAQLLEPRILYSAAPVEVEGGEPAAATVEQAAAQPAAATAQAQAPVVENPTADADPDVPADAGSGEVAPSQDVTLVDVDAATSALNQETVEALAVEARQRWIDSGISDEQIAALDAVEYHVADVGGAHLGVADGFSITIDDDAGGTGVGNWFIDATPGDDVEFGNEASAASGRYDLLSTLIHEQGHVLGLSDIFADRSDVMDGFLDSGTRRLPVEGQADGAVAGSIAGDNYLTANIVMASRDAAGLEGDNSSYVPVISANGRYVAFESDATNLVAGGTNGLRHIFVKDLVTGDVTLASSDSTGAQGTGGWSFGAVISADGRYVAFYSDANNLVAGDSNNRTDIFVKDLQTGVTTRASTDSSGGESNGYSYTPSISADGRYVVFESDATNLVGQDNNGEFDVFVKDLQTGELKRVSVRSNGSEASGGSHTSDISADGRYVSFTSGAADLVAGDTNGEDDIFVKDLKTGAVKRVSTRSGGGESMGGGSQNSAISADGRYVAFASSATNLVDDDTNGERDIFVKDLRTNRTTRVSTDSAGAESNDESILFNAGISDDGRFVVFHSDATNLVTGDGNSETDIFVKDLMNGSTTRVSTSSSGDEATGAGSTTAAISADGRFVAFQSSAVDLVDDDSNGKRDVFVKAVSSINPYTTSVHLDGAGNLIIEDIEGGDSKDNLLVEMNDGRLEISDRKNTVGSSIFGSMLVGTKGRAVSIDPASFSGDIIIRTLGGDDQVMIGDLSGLPGGIEVEEGDGHDRLTQKGEVGLTGGGELTYRSEEIRLARKSVINAETGNVSIIGNAVQTSLKKSVGLRIDAGTEISTTSGTVQLTGIGGVLGGGNHGSIISGATISSDSGGITVAGIAGAAKNGNRGLLLKNSTLSGAAGMFVGGVANNVTGGSNRALEISGRSNISATGTGGVSISGTGNAAATGSGNRGVTIGNGVEISAEDGMIGITGQAGGGKSGNIGARVGSATITTTGTGTIQVAGVGAGTGSNSKGLIMTRTMLLAGNATVPDNAVYIIGIGSQDGTGSGNAGAIIKSIHAEAAGGHVRVEGLSGAGRNGNYAVRMSNSTLISHTGGASVNGNSDLTGVTSMSTGSGNYGAYVSGSHIEGELVAGVVGVAKQGTSGNYGARLRSTDLISNNDIIVVGVSDETTTGSGNVGIDANRLTGTAGTSATFIAEGGSGISRNESLKLNRAMIDADGDILVEAGGALVQGAFYDINPLSTGVSNSGARISTSMFSSGSDLMIDAYSSSGTSRNVGLETKNSDFTSGGLMQINAAGATDSTGNGNRGFYDRGSSFVAKSVEIASERGAGVKDNDALHFRSTSVQSRAGILDISAGKDASRFTTGRNNSGVVLSRSTLQSADDLVIDAAGGGGDRDNRGISMVGGELDAQQDIDLTGLAAPGTGGSGNIGVYLFNGVNLTSPISIDINGTGGGGTGMNYGVFMNKNITAPGPNVIGISTDGVSANEAGDFFAP